jgi:hypothetical protein
MYSRFCYFPENQLLNEWFFYRIFLLAPLSKTTVAFSLAARQA